MSTNEAATITSINKQLIKAGSTLQIKVGKKAPKKRNEVDKELLNCIKLWTDQNGRVEATAKPKAREQLEELIKQENKKMNEAEKPTTIKPNESEANKQPQKLNKQDDKVMNETKKPAVAKSKEQQKNKNEDGSERVSLPLAARTRAAVRRRRAFDQDEQKKYQPAEPSSAVGTVPSLKPIIRKRKSVSCDTANLPAKRVRFDVEAEVKQRKHSNDKRNTAPLRSPSLIKHDETVQEAEITFAEEEIKRSPPPVQKRPLLSEQLMNMMKERIEAPASQQEVPPTHPNRVQFSADPQPYKFARPSLSFSAPTGQMIARPRQLIDRRPSWAGRPSLMGRPAEPLIEDHELELHEAKSTVIAPRRPSFYNFANLSPINSASDKTTSTVPNTGSIGPRPSMEAQPHHQPQHYGYDDNYDTLDRANGVRESLPPEMKRVVEEQLRGLPRHLTVRRTLENRNSALPNNVRESPERNVRMDDGH